jgi:hypothetical protein
MFSKTIFIFLCLCSIAYTLPIQFNEENEETGHRPIPPVDEIKIPVTTKPRRSSWGMGLPPSERSIKRTQSAMIIPSSGLDGGRDLMTEVEGDSSWGNLGYYFDAPSTLNETGKSVVTDEPGVDRKHISAENVIEEEVLEEVVEEVEKCEEGDKYVEAKVPREWCCPCFGF